MIVVVTGADGFIGKPVSHVLQQAGHEVRRVVRTTGSSAHASSCHVIGNIDADTDWRPILRGADVVLHLAARAHVIHDDPARAEEAFHRTNVLATRRLAEQAVECSVRRLVLMSSIGVNGAATTGIPFVETDIPRPCEPYARSKLAAEQALHEVSTRSALEPVILRPPLVYGPGAKGNLLRMLKLARSGIPLPLASLRNRRNLIGLSNLCDAIRLAIEIPAARGQTLLLAEPEARSTPELFAAMYAAFGMRNRLFPFPMPVLRGAAWLIGARRTLDKLCESLEIDASLAAKVLGWQPQTTFNEEIARTVERFVRRSGHP